MYSYEDRIRAVKLYIKYDFSAATVIRELGYPSRKALVGWYKEFQAKGDLKVVTERKPRYSEEQKQRAVNHYLEHGRCIRQTVRVLGYPPLMIFLFLCFALDIAVSRPLHLKHYL